MMAVAASPKTSPFSLIPQQEEETCLVICQLASGFFLFLLKLRINITPPSIARLMQISKQTKSILRALVISINPSEQRIKKSNFFSLKSGQPSLKKTLDPY